MDIRTTESIHEHMTVLAEPLRARLLYLLEQEELTVSDLCAVVQLPQSTVSRHLKVLLEKGWVDSRPDGTSRLYRGTVVDLGKGAEKLWELTRTGMHDGSNGRSDIARLRSVLTKRRSRTQQFFDASGDRWDALRDEMFGDHFSLEALFSLFPDTWTVGDLGCGTGRLVEAMAPWVRHVVGVDASESMLDIAARRLSAFNNVMLRSGTLESLPIEAKELDAATLMLVLHHVEDPQIAISEAARCLTDAGRLVIVDMLPHDRVEYQHDMGHVWLGFSEKQMTEYLNKAGFGATRFCALPPAPEAKGPNLFVVSANKKE